MNMPDNQIDKPLLDPPTLLIKSSATWLSAHAQKISRHVSMVTAATRMRVWGTRPFSDLITRKLPSRIIEVPDNGGPDNRGSTVIIKLIINNKFIKRILAKLRLTHQ